MRAPAFWSRDRVLPRVLSPLAAITAVLTARRVARPGWRAPVPVICCGNVTVGGAGKTTLVLDLARRLPGAHILLRGYGGSVRGVHRVHPDDPVALVGDEALLLAQVAPTWVAGDRGDSGRAAVAAGARTLLMDDGLQNPTLVKSASLLVIDGESGFGNGLVLPAGPLREPVAAGAARCVAAVLIGLDRTGAVARLPVGMPVLRANLVQDPAIETLRGRPVIAFAGIARPEKFFQPLRDAGAMVLAARAFPDHHPYTKRELDGFMAEADRHDAVLVTTPKDAVRLPAAARARVTVIGVGLDWAEAGAIDHLLVKCLAVEPGCMR